MILTFDTKIIVNLQTDFYNIVFYQSFKVLNLGLLGQRLQNKIFTEEFRFSKTSGRKVGSKD